MAPSTRARNQNPNGLQPPGPPPPKRNKKKPAPKKAPPPAEPLSPDPSPRYFSAATAAYQADKPDKTGLANLSFSQPRFDDYELEDSEGPTDDTDSENYEAPDPAEETILSQPETAASYFNQLAVTPARLQLPQTTVPSFPANPSFFNRHVAAPSSPIVALQERPQKRKRVDAPEPSATAGPSNTATGPSTNANAMRLPTMQELVDMIPVLPSSSTPKSVSFYDESEHAPRRRSKGVARPWQLQWHTPNSRTLLRIAKEGYRNSIAFRDAYPDDEGRARNARACWDFAIQQNPDVFANASIQSFNGHLLRLIADTAWAIRGQVKSEAKRIVPGHFKLHPPESLEGMSPKHAQEYTRQRVKYLLTNYRFLMGDFNGRPNTAFTDISLPLVIERAIFRNLGTESRELMNPMPAAMIALAATAVHNALEEWTHGYYSRKSMKEEDYAPIYRRYCKKLAQLRSGRPNRYLMILTSFYAFCLQASRSAPVGDEGHASSDDEWDVYGADSADDEPMH